eukprot:4755905-Lingulodinium_polyedra.AAC.1
MCACRPQTRSEGRWREVWERNVPLHDISAAVGAALCPGAALRQRARRPGATAKPRLEVMT